MPKNADPERTPLNQIIVSHGKNLADTINKRVKEGYKGKTAIRKDAVKAITVVLSGSHEHMNDLEKKGKLKAWVSSNHYWLSEKYGQENIVSLALHMDESTPHLHAVIVPLTKDGRLCAKEVIGDRIEMKKTQTAYATLMDVFGMSRGKEGSRARHEDVKEYYKRINNELPEIRKISQELHKEVGDFSRLKGFKMGAEALVSRLTKKDQVKVLKEQNQGLIQVNEYYTRQNQRLDEKIEELEKKTQGLKDDVNYYRNKIDDNERSKNREIMDERANGIKKIINYINHFLESKGLPKLDILLPYSSAPVVRFENDNRDNKKDNKNDRGR